MLGLGTWINCAAIIIGGIIGLQFGNHLKPRFHETLIQGLGAVSLFLGISGCLEKMFVFNGTSFTSQGSFMLIIAFAIGGFIGELINLEYQFERFGEWMKKKANSSSDPKFVEAYVTTTFTICIGAMAVVGAIMDGVQHDYSLLLNKSILDFITVMIMSASMGKGCIFSAISVFFFQFPITLLSTFIEPLLTTQALTNLSLSGSILIFCVGINLIWGKKVKIANLLPAILVAMIFAYF